MQTQVKFFFTLWLCLFSLAASANENHCSGIYESLKPRDKFEAIEMNFRRHPLLLYAEDLDPAYGHGGAFFVSNEFDLYRAPIITTPTDLVVGFSTNTAYDIAIRMNAKELILVDWAQGPLIGQEYFLRPLGLIASSASELVSFLSGVRVPPDLASSPIADTFRYIEGRKRRAPQQKFVQDIHQRLLQDKRITPQQTAAVLDYYDTYKTSGLRGPGENFGSFRGAKSGVLYNYFEYFRDRYIHPSSSEADLLFSFISSPEAFARYKYLIDGHIHYIQSNIYSLKLGETVSNFAKEKGLELVTFSISNVIGALALSSAEAYERRVKLFSFWSHFFSAPTHPMHIFELTGTVPSEHRYYHHVIRTEKDVVPSVSDLLSSEILKGFLQPHQARPQGMEWYQLLQYCR